MPLEAPADPLVCQSALAASIHYKECSSMELLNSKGYKNKYWRYIQKTETLSGHTHYMQIIHVGWFGIYKALFWEYVIFTQLQDVLCMKTFAVIL